jgi:hypothetical protein
MPSGERLIPEFHSILTERPRAGARPADPPEPPSFGDLNLDQAVESMTAGREEYRLPPIFYAPLHDVATVEYRHEVIRDLERRDIHRAVGAFAQEMREMRKRLTQSDKLYYKFQKEYWFLDAVETYCAAVHTFTEDLAGLDLASRGLLGFREYLAKYAVSEAFTAMEAELRGLKHELAAIRYNVHIRGARVTVSDYEDEPDYSTEVQDTFAKFRQGAVKDYRAELRDFPDMNHVEAHILEFVARLHPDVFAELDDYRVRYQDFTDPKVTDFDREIQFYLAYLDYIAPLRKAGLAFSYPHMSAVSKEENARASFDLALARKLVADGRKVVYNDIELTGPERVIVVTGPNQGGKTTFARMLGQLHYLAGLGLPVPGRDVRLHLPDRVFTHFEREEDIQTLSGKLEDELIRIHQVLAEATADSVIVMNESFTSTTLHDALYLGTQVLNRIIAADVLCVCVTFVDELASLGDSTLSMVAAIDPADPASRTFQIVRRQADGLAYAAAIAAKYGLTYQSLKGRITP